VSAEDMFCGSGTVGERGQVVIPAAARRACGINPGDRLLVFTDPHKHGVMLASVRFLDELTKLHEALLAAARGEADRSTSADVEGDDSE